MATPNYGYEKRQKELAKKKKKEEKLRDKAQRKSSDGSDSDLSQEQATNGQPGGAPHPDTAA